MQSPPNTRPPDEAARRLIIRKTLPRTETRGDLAGATASQPYPLIFSNMLATRRAIDGGFGARCDEIASLRDAWQRSYTSNFLAGPMT